MKRRRKDKLRFERGGFSVMRGGVRGLFCLLFVGLFIGLNPSSAYSRCADALAKMAGSQNQSSTKSWTAKATTTSDRLKLLLSLLDRHPNIIESNPFHNLSLLDVYSQVPEVLEALGENASSLETTPPRVHRLRYVSSGEARYDEKALSSFREARVKDVESLNLVDGGDIATQIRHFKETSRNTDGSFNEKKFRKQIRRFLRVMSLIFDSSGKPRFQKWQEERLYLVQMIRTLRPAGIESQYGDLLKEHLSPLIEEISKEKGFGQVQEWFRGIQNNFIKKEVREALTPLKTDGSVQVRVLSLETLPAWVSIVRGCYGGDCSIKSIPYYPLVKGVRVHFIRKSHDLSEEPSGYAFSVPVKVKGRDVPYILTINGATLTEVDVEMAVRSIAEEFGSNEVVLPDFKKNPYIVNSRAARSGMTQERREKVVVEFPLGWSSVDSYMNNHQTGLENYYRGSSIEDAYLSRLADSDKRLLSSESKIEGDVSYRQLVDLTAMPLNQRAILGSQAVSVSKKTSGEALEIVDISRALDLTEAQIEAASPLTNISKIRGLNLSEYKQLQVDFGFGLNDLLELRGGARAASLIKLYEEDPNLFSEHKIRQNPKGIKALIEAYGLYFVEEAKKIINDQNLSDVDALQALQDLRIRNLAKELIEHEDVLVRHSAAEALSQIGEKAAPAMPALIEALKDDEVWVRQKAAKALGQIGEKAAPAMPAFIEALKDDEVWVRQKAAEALGQIGEKATPAVPALIEALKDDEVWVRQSAAEALSRIGEKAAPAVPALIEALKDDEVWVRESAAEALGRIGEKAAPAVPALLEALKDDRVWVRESAAEALRKIDKKDADAVNDSWLRKAAKGIIRLIQFKEK